MHCRRLFLVSIALLGVFRTAGWAQTKTPPVKVDGAFFEKQVRPVLEKSCLGCHGVDGQMSHLDLRTRAAALKGGTRGAAIVAGDSTRSLLYKLVNGSRAPLMPPGGKLPPAQVATLKQWIDGGAPWGGAEIKTAHKQVWWAFRPVEKVTPPTIAGVTNPIDAFVLTRLREKGLTFAPDADRRTLIRRVSLDLIGLPPTPEEVDAFVADKAPGAYERLVDRLLASPDYGERWGRHWLDLARYADSGGFEGDKDRPLMYRYRDWVIDAFNRDLPYGEFLRLQIAGDELKPGDNDALIATGYLAAGPQDIVENNARTRANEIDDLVATTSSVVLGLTVGCARCHDHKYDPVTQTDYYRLAAVFAPTERREVEIPSPEQRKAAEAKNAELEPQLAPLRMQAETLKKANNDAAGLKAVEEKIAALEAQRIALPKALAVTDKEAAFPPSHLLIRGDAYHPGPEVQPGFVCSLPGGDANIGPAPAGSATTKRRSALAAWLSDPKNPLTARVWMNRIWRQHFGRGIVASTSNFGISGDLPTHPELLDWLARSFVAGGERLKPIHRLMVLSRTYRQSSSRDPKAMAADPENRLYARMPVRRLEAEAIRDSLLSIAGTLNRDRGGPAVYPPVDPSLRADTFQGMNWPEAQDTPATWRRSVYVKVKRSLLLPQLEVFDCPEITYTVAQRNVTTTPLQALTLLNDPLIVRQAGLFAARLEKERPGDPAAQIERAYRLAFGRAPTERERNLSAAFLKTRPLADFCHALFNLNELVYVP